MFLNGNTSSRVNVSIGGFNTAILGNLSSVGNRLQKTLMAISTGFKVNSAADAPAASAEIAHTDANLNNISSALSNNQLSFNRLSSVDAVQKEVLNTLLEIRENAQELQGSSDHTVRRTLMETIAAQLSALDTLAKQGKLGGRNVLDGSSAIAFGANAATCLDTRNTFVRSARSNGALKISFNSADAAEQARISGTLALPTADKSSFMVTTNTGSKTIEIAAGTSLSDALAQINKSLDSIGARAEVATDNAGNRTLSFMTNGYGNGFSIRYEHISGQSLIGDNQSATGKTGSVRVNAARYDLSGEYGNFAAESAQIRGQANSGAIAATDLTFTTQNGTATLANFSASDITAAINTINSSAEIVELGISATLDNGMISFQTADTGTKAVLDFRDSAGQLFADGRQGSAATGKNYHPGDGIAVNYATQEINATLAFDIDKIAVGSPANGVVRPADFSVTLQAAGGTNFQIGAGNGFYDSVNYSFRDITSAGLGLNRLTDSSSSLYLMNNDGSALDYIDSAISLVQREYGALGAFMNYNLDSTSTAMEALQSSLGDIRGILADADMATETLQAVQLQILQQSNVSALTASANYSQMIAALLPSVN